MIDSIYTANMNPQQRNWFFAEYQRASKDEIVAVLLAFFLGTFGIHHYYLHRNGLGTLYLVFFWTGIPAILGFIDCFLMPGRVRDYNATQASFIAAQILALPSAPATPAEPTLNPATALPTTIPCPTCNQPIDPAATFCPHCGAQRTPTV